MSRKGTCIDHRAIKPLSIGLYFNIEISYQICYILREFCRLGCSCYRYMFQIKTDKVSSNPKYRALLRSAVYSWLASLPMTNCIQRMTFWWPSAYTSVIYVAVTMCILKNAVGLSIVDIVKSAQRSRGYFHLIETKYS